MCLCYKYIKQTYQAATIFPNNNNNQLGDILDANILTINKAVHIPMKFAPNKSL